MVSSMNVNSNKRITQGAGPIAVILAVAMGILSSASVLAQNDDKVRTGLRLWHESSCADCHGSFADGNREDEDWPVGANLRTTRLDAAGLKLTISCGRAGAGM